MNHKTFRPRRLFAAGGILGAFSLLLGMGGAVNADVIDGPAVPGQIILKVPAGMTSDDVAALAEKINCSVLRPIDSEDGFYLLGDKTRSAPVAVAPSRSKFRGRAAFPPLSQDFKNKIEALRAVPGVLADPNYVRFIHQTTTPQTTTPGNVTTLTPNDPFYPAGSAISPAGQAWHFGLINMPQAWAIQSNIAGRTVLAADLDTGIDPGHPDLVNRISPLSRDFTNIDASGNPSTTLADVNGHGTHTGGTIGAEVNNNVGVASVGGWNQGGVDIQIVACRVSVDGSISEDAEVAALKYCAQNGVDVANMSFGGPFGSDTEHAAIIIASTAGVTLVASAGNSGTDNFGRPDPKGAMVPNYPASYPEVINVSAVGPEKELAVYSSYGSNVAVTAPGGDDPNFNNPARMVISTYPRGHASAYATVPSPVDGYSADQGTSMAAPHVSGAVALLIACGAPRNPTTIKNILQSTAQRLPDEVPSPSLLGGKYGAGLIDVYKAILPFADPPFVISVPGVAFASASNGSTTAGSLAAGDVPYADRGQTYSSAQLPIYILASGVSKRTASDVATVQIQTATTPTTVLQTFTSASSGTDGFVIPTLPAGAPKGTTFLIQVPTTGGNAIVVPDGRYKAVVTFNGVTKGIIFFEKVSRSQPLGRALFSTPFQVRQVDANTPEQTLFGPGTTFSLARYNPLRLPSDFDYALFQSGSGGRSDAAARFGAAALNGEPLSYDTSNPTVSVAPVGLGYWLKLDSAVILNTSGAVVSNPVGVKCYASNGGWNMIGDPYPFSVSWGTVSVVANGQTYSLLDAVNARILSGALVSYPNGDYQYDVAPGGTLQPFSGYWVRVYQDCTLIIAPTGGTNGSGRAVKNTSVSTASPLASGWKVRLGAFVGGDRDGQNFFGQVKSTKNGLSRLALPKPPSGAGHAYVRFVDTSSRAVNAADGAMAYDLRATASGTEGTTRETWTAEVSTDKPDTDVVLTWDGLGTAPRRAGLFLTDTATGRKVSLRDRSSYTYKSGEAGSTHRFTLSLEPIHTSGPLAINNLTISNFGKAVGGGLAIRFNTTREGEITGFVKTFDGKVVGILNGASRAAATSTTTLHWTGRGVNGAALPAGTYQIEITLRDADGNTATAKQPVSSLR